MTVIQGCAGIIMGNDKNLKGITELYTHLLVLNKEISVYSMTNGLGKNREDYNRV